MFYAGFYPGQTVPAQKGVAGAGPFVAPEAVFGQQFPVTATTQIPFQAVPAGWGAIPTQAVWPGAAAPLVTQPFAGVPVFPEELEADLYEDDILGIHPFRRGFRRRFRRFGVPFAKRAFGKPFVKAHGKPLAKGYGKPFGKVYY
jgi:hypothetical protein